MAQACADHCVLVRNCLQERIYITINLNPLRMKLGIDKTAMVRVRAGISYALTEAMDEGHCGLPSDELVPLAEKLLEVPQELSAREAG